VHGPRHFHHRHLEGPSPWHRWRARMRLQRRLFLWFGASIFVTGLVVSLVFAVLGKLEGSGPPRWQGATELLSWQAAQVWDRPVDRAAWAAHLAEGLGWSVQLEDAEHHPVGAAGPPPRRTQLLAPVTVGGSLAGWVRIDANPTHPGGLWTVALVLLILFGMLWGAAGRIARRIAWPLAELSRVARALGEGRLSTRAEVRGPGEVRELAQVMNEMAGRIERQLGDQRELLATVSHELRTPLSRVRLLVELGRSGAAAEKTLDEVEAEVVEMDRLVGELLAGARMDFSAMARVTLDGRDVAARALQRAALAPGLLQVEAAERTFQGDPTLLGRALANLLDNAGRHGGGVVALRLAREPSALVFSVEDAGPGIPPGEETRLFQPFRRGSRSSDGEEAGLGLGLALVRRIAEAHGGRAFAENRPGGGARVGFSVTA
jgi:two-component system, OmpR family, sensor kinase